MKESALHKACRLARDRAEDVHAEGKYIVIGEGAHGFTIVTSVPIDVVALLRQALAGVQGQAPPGMTKLSERKIVAIVESEEGEA